MDAMHHIYRDSSRRYKGTFLSEIENPSRHGRTCKTELGGAAPVPSERLERGEEGWAIQIEGLSCRVGMAGPRPDRTWVRVPWRGRRTSLLPAGGRAGSRCAAAPVAWVVHVQLPPTDAVGPNCTCTTRSSAGGIWVPSYYRQQPRPETLEACTMDLRPSACCGLVVMGARSGNQVLRSRQQGHPSLHAQLPSSGSDASWCH